MLDPHFESFIERLDPFTASCVKRTVRQWNGHELRLYVLARPGFEKLARAPSSEWIANSFAATYPKGSTCEVRHGYAGDDACEFDDLAETRRTELVALIRSKLTAPRSKARVVKVGSYHLKHRFEDILRALGRGAESYISNGAFKGAMRDAGFEPVDSSEQNWDFRLVAKELRALETPPTPYSAQNHGTSEVE